MTSSFPLSFPAVSTIVTRGYSAFEPFPRVNRLRAGARSHLALRAVIRGTVPPPVAHDRRSAPAARLALLPIHLQVVLELPLLPIQVAVGLVFQRDPAVTDAVLEDLLHRAIQTAHLLRRQLVRGPLVPETRSPKDLVRIDIADA